MLTIIKIGGNVINDNSTLREFLWQFKEYPGNKILVHGGGKEATELSKKLGVPTQMIDGRRITDHATLDIVTMVYAGLINKRIVSLLQDVGCNALGLSGADGHVIPAKRRNPVPIDYGYVGDILTDRINTTLLLSLLAQDITPVICAICHQPNGSLLNCNADSVASAIALAFKRLETVNLIYCFEKPGVLADQNDDTSVIPFITPQNFDNLCARGIISGGMLPKLSNALNAVNEGVAKVRICKAEDLLKDSGTIIAL